MLRDDDKIGFTLEIKYRTSLQPKAKTIHKCKNLKPNSQGQR